MKFAKYLRTESVPEWKEKYIDYKGLKILLNAIDLKPTTQPTPSSPLDNEVTISISQPTATHDHASRTFKTNSLSGIISKSSNLMNRMSKNCSNAIQKRIYSLQNVKNPIESYESLWNQIASQEREFFITLEDNLNKVENFYETKLSEAIRHFEKLKIQHKCMKETSKEWSGPTTPISRVEETIFRAKRDMDNNSAKKIIKKAILEFYRGIELLKNYKILNQTGFTKILKKYDKFTKSNGSEIYLPRIANYNFVKSPVLDKLFQETEAFYVNNFEGAKRQLQLPNKERKTHYFVTWRVGLYIGLSIPLMVRAVELVGECKEKWSFIVPILSSLPPWWRFVQCWKRYFDTSHKFPHLANAGKYLLSMATLWLFFFETFASFSIGCQIVSSTYSLLWDLLMDWSLLQLDSKNYLLRDNISFKSYVYYFAIISNGLLRFSWVLKFTIPQKYIKITVYVIGYFEMLRRWQWSLLRIENEHVNNCGQFRAVKEIPLPFEKDEAIREKIGLRKSQGILIPENNLFPTILFHDDSQKFEYTYEENNTNLAESTENDDMLSINRVRQRELSLISLEGRLISSNNNHALNNVSAFK
ncbi:11696_t:CDS:10 [Funneliformis geosporum]|uniref:12029_t:CDS:1 n=1 Tax=Funneliformis geosporum TaxID=1117311 RepID=A0A9W4SEM1_9GLOM|nr:12029_t:CDS:10 [Funneliformis geosporum]CAI2167520.1 11696_t:CDS:10 [Funneliformis geosporum]